ncbi:retrovirus-related pol polyprotein from transposon TNT 1-94 [Tanacetum coccineum]
MSGTRANIPGMGWNNSGQQRAVKCFNCQWEGHMARQCPKPKRKRDATWFRDKVLLVKAQENGKVLNEEELEFLADPGVAEAKEVLMANLSSYGSDVIFEDTNSSVQQDTMILSVFKQLSNQVTNCNKVNKDNLIANESLSAELERTKNGINKEFQKVADYNINTPYLKTLENSRPMPDFKEYANDTPYVILWSKIKKNIFSANTPYPKTPILRIGQYSVSKKSDMDKIWRIQYDLGYALSHQVRFPEDQ